MRRQFGMSAREVFTETPGWEVELLVEEWNAEQERLKGDD